jgi:signal transduction histidine kinase
VRHCGLRKGSTYKVPASPKNPDPFMRWPIRAQFLTPVALLLLGTAAISFWTAWAAARQARLQVEDRQRDVARFIVEEFHVGLSEGVLRQLEPLSGAEYCLLRQNGQRRTSLRIDPATLQLTGPVADDWQALRLGEPELIAGQTYLCSGVRLKRGEHAGDVLYILYPESLLRDARWEAIRPSLILGVSVGVAALLVALAQAQGLARRLRELGRQTRRIAGGDFGPMPLPGTDDELRDLAGSVNEMAERLARFQQTVELTERFRLLGQISGGLAHQLRNGLTGARLAVQLYLHENAGGDVSALEVALRQLSLLETHTRRFLDMGREGPARREPCELRELVGEAVELLRPQCRHAGIDLAWTPPEQPCVIAGDAGQLGQVVINLLGNAIEAAGPGGQILVQLQIDQTEEVSNVAPVIRLEVCDSGPGPLAELAERLFEPFVTGKPEGVGLGLAVAKRVAEGHGGKIGWKRDEGQTCFWVELPSRGASL